MIGAIARARAQGRMAAEARAAALPVPSRLSRSQAGYTLIEMMIGVSITAIILVPLMAWAVLVMRQQPVERDGMMRTAQTGLLGSMFPSDVSVAGQALVSGTDEPWAGDCSGGDSGGREIQLVMISAGATVQKVVYTVAPSGEDPGQSSIWRRTCGLGSDNALQSEMQLFRGVKPGLTAVSCSSLPGDAPCREIALTMTPLTTDQAVNISATRRVDNSTPSVDALGNPLPSAWITLESRTALQPMEAVFSGRLSTVGPGRTIDSYAWEFEPDVTFSNPTDPMADTVTAQFPLLAADQPTREFTVRLTVTDDLGRSNTHHFLISSSNANPIAVISSIDPDPVTVGETVSFSAVPGSYDPDGLIIRFDWLITLPQLDSSAPTREVRLSGPTASYTTKAGDAGPASVRLSATDLQLGQSTVSEPFTIVDPAAPPTTTTTTTLPTAGPVVAVFVDSPGASALVRVFDASTSTGIGPGTSFAWTFGDGTTGTGRAVAHTFPNGGSFDVSLTVTTSDDRSASATRKVTVAGDSPIPVNVRHNGTHVLWDPVAGAKRYLVDFEFRTPTDCFQSIPNQLVGATPSPSKQIPRNPCPRTASARARVGADSGSSISWSAWISIPTINTPITPTPPPTTPPTTQPVVK